MKRWILLSCALFLFAGGLSAQQTTADIYGTVVLSDGSVLPGVKVILTADVLGMQTTVTSREGNFRFLRLLPSTYELKLELDGFKTVIQKGVRLYAGKNVTLAIPMETSALNEQVTVLAKPPVIDTRRTTVGMNLTKEALESLPRHAAHHRGHEPHQRSAAVAAQCPQPLVGAQPGPRHHDQHGRRRR